MRPYHGRAGEFIYYRSIIHGSTADFLTICVGMFVLGAIAGYMLGYSACFDKLVMGW